LVADALKRATNGQAIGNSSPEELQARSNQVTHLVNASQHEGSGIVVLNERISVSSNGVLDNARPYIMRNCISADGRYVAFVSDSNQLVPDDTNGCEDVFVRDRIEGKTTRVSVASDGAESDEPSEAACISADGRFVCFRSLAKNFAQPSEVGARHSWGIFLHDRHTGSTLLVSADLSSRGEFHLAAEGSFVVYVRDDDVICLYDPVNRSTQEVMDGSVFGDEKTRYFHSPVISADGRRIAFLEDGQVYLFDRRLGSLTLVTRNYRTHAAVESPNCEGLIISPDGRFMAFHSRCSELVPRDSNRSEDVFLYDHRTGSITRVSVSSTNGQAAGPSKWPSISSDGNRILFRSDAKNLVGPPVNHSGIYLHDRLSGTTQRVDSNWDGSEPDSWWGSDGKLDGKIALTGDGQLALFCGKKYEKFVKDDPDVPGIYARQLKPATPPAISQSPTSATGESDEQSQSANPFGLDAPSATPSAEAQLVQPPASLEQPIAVMTRGTDREDDNLFLSFSHDGTLLASATCFYPNRNLNMPSTRVRIWDTRSGQQVRLFEHIGSPRAIAFVADGKRVCDFSHRKYAGDKTANLVHVLDVSTGRQQITLALPYSKYGWWNKLVVAPSGLRFAFTLEDTRESRGIRFFETLTGRQISAVARSDWNVNSIYSGTFSHDGKYFACNTYAEQQTINLWNVQRGTLDSTLAAEGVLSDFMTFAPGDTHLILSSGGRASIWDVASRRRIGDFGKDVTHELGISADSRRMVSHYGNTLHIWDYRAKVLLHGLEDAQFVKQIAHSPNGSCIAVCKGEGDRVWLLKKESIDGLIAHKITELANDRPWSDITGTYVVPATCVGVDREHVWLRRKDEQTIRVEMAALNKRDREYARHLHQLNSALRPIASEATQSSTSPESSSPAEPTKSSLRTPTKSVHAVEWPVSSGGNGHFYQAVATPGDIGWDQAQAAAKAAGGYLATITSKAENDFVFALVDRDQFWSRSSALFGPWIGGLQPPGSSEPDHGWSWPTGEKFKYAKGVARLARYAACPYSLFCSC
jgi:Tol biopolymer transport system component